MRVGKVNGMKALAGVVAAIALFAAGYSCNTSGCTENQSALPLAGFCSSTTGNAISVSDMEVRGLGAPDDSVLYAAESTPRAEVYLPFRSTKDNTTYLFTYYVDSVTTVTDQVTFTYTSEPRFVSEECGAMFFYHINKVDYTTNLIDSVVVTDSLINNLNIKRILIYFRTAEPENPDEND